MLVDGLATKAVVVGDDFHFGRHREGNVALLRELGREMDFEVEPVSLVERAGRRRRAGQLDGHPAGAGRR